MGLCGADKGWVVDADDSGREEEGKGLKATSWFNGLYDVRPGLPNASSSVHTRPNPLRRCSCCLGACPGPTRSRRRWGRIEPHMVFSRSVCLLFIHLLFSFPPYFFQVDVLMLSSSYPPPMLMYPVTQHHTSITRMVLIALGNVPETQPYPNTIKSSPLPYI